MMIHNRITITIKTDKVSDWAREEFCEYLKELSTLKDFVWCAGTIESVDVMQIEPELIQLDFTFSGYIYDWMDSHEDDLIESIQRKYGTTHTEIYMGIEPIRFIVTDIKIV